MVQSFVNIYDSNSSNLARSPKMSRVDSPHFNRSRTRCSCSCRSVAALATDSADLALTTTTPSESATMTSPGCTHTPAHSIGTFTDPGPFFVVPFAEISLAQTGNRIAVSSDTSLTPASMTSATTPRTWLESPSKLPNMP